MRIHNSTSLVSEPAIAADATECRQLPGVVQRIEELAAARPDSTAVVVGGPSLTFEQLNSHASRFARYLETQGAGPGVVVGLLMPRSACAVVAALGILKTGAAYLPLDQDNPAKHVSFVLGDSRTRLVVTDKGWAERIKEGIQKVVLLGAVGDQFAAYSGDALRRKGGPDDLAYVIYTSGSTGKPKGVEITHRSLANLISWHQRAFSVTHSDKATQFSSLGFDAAVWELWPHLSAGAAVHVVPEAVRKDPEALRNWLVAEKITISFAPTPMAEMLIALQWPADAALRVLLAGGDKLYHFPRPGLPFQLVNNYGPTESTVVTTSGVVSPQAAPTGSPSIGRPIDQIHVYVLDEKLMPVPDGEVGELYIGGLGLARGYRHRPDLTAERFVPNPFPGGSARMYRSGDLVRRLPDGNIAFLGRADDQIKIAGFRIEPNEIAAVLKTHPDVQAAAVRAREDNPGTKRLVAYLVLRQGASLTEGAVRSFLEERLPAHMVPSVFVQLDTLPTTANGKVDREALPVPESAKVLRDAVFVPAQNPVEQRVSAILIQLLGLELVGRDDNFFFLGGHSLLGTQLIGRVRDAFGVELSLRTVFDSPTVAQLSEEVQRLLLARIDSMSEEEAQRLLGLTGTVDSQGSVA